MRFNKQKKLLSNYKMKLLRNKMRNNKNKDSRKLEINKMRWISKTNSNQNK